MHLLLWAHACQSARKGWFIPYGRLRWTGTGSLPTDRTYTGQREEASMGLMDYNARYYDPSMMQFIQPDTLIPDPYNPLAWNRYSYVFYNPINRNDPTGNMPTDGCKYEGCSLVNKEQSRRVVVDSLLKNAKAWSNLPEGYKTTLENAGYTESSYVLTEMSMSHGVRNAYWYEDPATYLSAAGGGVIGAISRGAIIEGVVGGEAYDCVSDGQCPAVTVLGRFPNYINVAKDIGGKIFSIPPEQFEPLSREVQWALNQKYLDDAIANGNTFYLASKWVNAEVGSFYRQELEYLFSRGYTLSVYQNYLIPPNH